MLVWTAVAGDARVLREAETLTTAGHRVHVVGRAVPADFVPPAGLTVSSVGSGPRSGAAGAAATRAGAAGHAIRLARWVLLPTHVQRRLRAWTRAAERDAHDRAFDVVHAHDFTTLRLGASLAERRGVPLVYDAHELWSGRPRVGRPAPLQAARERRVERRLGGAATAVLTVGEGVASALRDEYGWRHVTVVRNSFPLDPDSRERTRGKPAGLVYAGRLAAYRELETIAAASEAIALPVTLVGPADQSWLERFAPGRATVRGPLPLEAVDTLLAEAGLALVTHSDRWPNHRLALPNKLFHAVRVGVPVVATDVGELAKVVRRHGIGTLYRPGDPGSLARAVEAAVTRYPDLAAAVRAAGPALSWDVDAKRLLEVYRELSG